MVGYLSLELILGPVNDSSVEPKKPMCAALAQVKDVGLGARIDIMIDDFTNEIAISKRGVRLAPILLPPSVKECGPDFPEL